MGELLCHSCITEKLDACKFKEVASELATGVPPLSNQKPIEKGDIRTIEDTTRINRPNASFAISRTIQEMRAQAEERGCLYSQTFDPPYPGRERL